MPIRAKSAWIISATRLPLGLYGRLTGMYHRSISRPREWPASASRPRAACERVTGAGIGALCRRLFALLDRLIEKLLDAAAQALFFGQGPLASLFKGGGSGGFAAAGGMGPSFFGTGSLYARGGVVRGPGNGTSDSIPARLSNGEFVVNARATGRHRALLEAINANRLPGFANGGAVSAPSLRQREAGGSTRIRFEVVDRAGVQIEQAGRPRSQGRETIIPVMIRSLKEEMAADIAGNGPVGKAMQNTFGLSRRTR